jgi:translocation and assembly module TamA
VTVTVRPGPRTQVTALNVQTTGELNRRADNGNVEAKSLLDELPSAAVLQPGKPFRNPDWSSSKQQVATRLRSAGYALANLSSSAADVDAAERSASLFMLADSGPLFKAGPLEITGLKAHDEATVKALSGFGPGAPLTEPLLLDFQERLQKVGLFESVLVSFEPDAAKPDDTPVKVRLKELPLQQATVGLGISANTGPRGTLEHTHRRPFGYAVTAINKLEWGRDAQSWKGDLLTHPKDGFYSNLLGVQIERLKSDTDAVLSQRLRLGRIQDTPRIDRLGFLELLRSRQSDTTGVQTAEAISANLHLVWRDVDSALLPTRGLVAGLQTGAGLSRSDSGNGPFARLYGRLTGYLPLGQTWYGQARIEMGQIFKRDGTGVPDALGFRAGGDDSVRGYAHRSLAPLDAQGAVASGNLLLTTSVEVARPIVETIPELWGAVFVDAGRAVNRWADFKPAYGYGVGVRYRSPIGPLRADLAWGQEVQRLRLHLSVGVTF